MAKHLLVVDDSPTMRNMIKETLEQAGFEITTAQDGEKALRVMKGKKLDMIITDIIMPIMDGIEFIQHLRESEDFKSIPILVISTESGAKKEEGRTIGASGWIVKPFKPEVLIGAVNKLCK